MRRVLVLVLVSTGIGCVSPWSLRSKTGTAFNLYDYSRYVEKNACEGPRSQNKPGWCGPCQYALNRQLDAVGLAQDAEKRPGSAPYQKKLLAKTSAAVKTACLP